MPMVEVSNGGTDTLLLRVRVVHAINAKTATVYFYTNSNGSQLNETIKTYSSSTYFSGTFDDTIDGNACHMVFANAVIDGQTYFALTITCTTSSGLTSTETKIKLNLQADASYPYDVTDSIKW